MKKFLIASCAALLLPAAALVSTAALADVSAEIVVASQHAGFAAKAPAIAGVHTHLHHVVNCLVGPSGTGFDASNANPCASAGNGAIPDAMGPQKEKLQAALVQANAGLAATDVAAAQKDASDAAATIDSAK